MAKLNVATAPAPKMEASVEQYISRTWLSKANAPTVDPSKFAGAKAKVFRITGGTGPHTILYIEGVDPNAKL